MSSCSNGHACRGRCIIFSINVDLSQLDDLLDIGPTLKKAASDASVELGKMAVARAKEEAAKKLHTRRKMYQDGLSFEKVGDDTVLIILDKKVRWIDDGQSAFDMLKYLLNSPKAKTGKNGKYITIPFDGAGPTQGGKTGRIEGANKVGRTSAEQDLMNAVKKELKAKDIPFGKIEKNADGSDKLGKLHSFSISNAPLKKDAGPGQRRGPTGEVMQGNTGIPFLQGVSIYQNKDNKGKTKRSILTFRVATESQGGTAKWEHPGNAAVDILEKAVEDAIDIWQKEVAPALMEKALKG